MRLGSIRSAMMDVPLLRNVPDVMQERLAMVLFWISEAVRAEPGERLYEEGMQDDDSGCLLLEGAVWVTHGSNEPIQVKAPALLGEMHQFTPEHARTATVEIAEPAVLMRFLWHDFVGMSLQFFTKSEQAALKEVITRDASNRFSELYDQLVEKRMADEGAATEIQE